MKYYIFSLLLLPLSINAKSYSEIERNIHFKKVKAQYLGDAFDQKDTYPVMSEKLRSSSRKYLIPYNKRDVFKEAVKVLNDKKYKIKKIDKEKGIILAESPKINIIKNFFSSWEWEYKYQIMIDIKRGLYSSNQVYLDVYVVKFEKPPMSKKYILQENNDEAKNIKNSLIDALDKVFW